MSLLAAGASADCPACKRYIGRVSVCPFCDVDIPVPLRLRLLRISAPALAVGGLLPLWLAARGLSGDASSRAGSSILPDLSFHLHSILTPHLHWMLWCGIVLLLLGEPTRPVAVGKAGWRRFMTANRPLGMATLVFLLAGMVGFIVMQAAPLTPGIILLALIPATGIASLPRLYGVRYRNTLGSIMLPLACELSGLAPALAAVLHLR